MGFVSWRISMGLFPVEFPEIFWNVNRSPYQVLNFDSSSYLDPVSIQDQNVKGQYCHLISRIIFEIAKSQIKTLIHILSFAVLCLKIISASFFWILLILFCWCRLLNCQYPAHRPGNDLVMCLPTVQCLYIDWLNRVASCLLTKWSYHHLSLQACVTFKELKLELHA